MKQYMTQKHGTRPVFAITVRDLPNGIRVVDALSEVISMRWRVLEDCVVVKRLEPEQAGIDETVLHEHISQALGYLEYTARFKLKIPHVSIVGLPHWHLVYEQRGYVNTGWAFEKHLYHS